MQQNQIKILLAPLFISVVLSCGANKAAGQNTSHLPPPKAAVVKQLYDELAKRHYLFGCIMDNPALTPAATSERQRQVESALDNLDPMLIGRHVVFSKRWLDYVGPGKPISRQELDDLRDRTDRVYGAYKELTGKAPMAGEKVFFHISPWGNAGAHAHANMFCWHESGAANGLQGGDGAMMHELAHVFAHATNWEIDGESIVPLLMAYALETMPGEQSGNKIRKSVVEEALNRYRKNDIAAFGIDRGTWNAYECHAFDLYLLGLVDKVGWETYKKVIRSYADEPHVVHARFPGGQAGKARDFFNRLERFSGKPGVLRSLPDKGELLDKFFNVQNSSANQTANTPNMQAATSTSHGGTSSPYDSPYEDMFDAAEMGTARDVESFVNKGGDVNAKNAVGFTALHYAAHYNQNIGVLRYLISVGASVNAKTNLGRTPLHQAAMSEDAETAVVRYLIAQGADVNAKCNAGQTPLDIANTEAKKAALREAGGRSGR